jgi:hypothetical protein
MKSIVEIKFHLIHEHVSGRLALHTGFIHNKPSDSRRFLRKAKISAESLSVASIAWIVNFPPGTFRTPQPLLPDEKLDEDVSPHVLLMAVTSNHL